METMGATDPNSPSDIPEALINTGNAASVAEVAPNRLFTATVRVRTAVSFADSYWIHFQL
jgi:hypothetical protein